MDDADVLRRIEAEGLELPDPPVPVAAYVPVVVTGSLAFVAGQVPIIDGQVLHPGLLGGGVSVEQGYEGGRRAALQALSALRAELGSFDRLVRIAQVMVYIASTPDFSEHPKVANGASDSWSPSSVTPASTHGPRSGWRPFRSAEASRWR